MEYEVREVQVTFEPHPNADTLSVANVDGWNCVIKTSEWSQGETGLFVEPDTIVPAGTFGNEKPERIRAKKIRGVVSAGMLIKPAPELRGLPPTEVFKALGFEHYQPQSNLKADRDYVSKGPRPPRPFEKYDVMPWGKYRHLFEAGEEVIITEKIHGMNARVYRTPEGELMFGSRNRWVDSDPKTGRISRAVFESGAVQFLPYGWTFLGEVFGKGVQCFDYGKAEPAFAVFEVRNQNMEVVHTTIPEDGGVPVLYRGPYSDEVVERLRSGPTTFNAQHVREGCVVEPVVPRWCCEVGNMKLKAVNPDYLTKSG